ncbi:sirohydrochlorin chelatase [Frankia sp. R82]|uniref:sirohydrochlorin chelatase n=1 Tax=Frankia sp. R82 TaxID=2950553 RepID=UPI002043C917|nr:CbiX/SirB N-terminal domain-containing protein [Frankia sp. R82]MCM3885014.1 CbiX/SirB N-terminal domain-containing protein [Frankia sp. R82]
MRGLLVIGHGSRRGEANATVRELARRLADEQGEEQHGARRWGPVEAAFLEVSHPDIAEGYDALAAAGCTEIIAYPFFLFDGNHTHRDIPAALDVARERHPATRWVLSEPLGLHACVVAAVRARLEDTLSGLVHAAGVSPAGRD